MSTSPTPSAEDNTAKTFVVTGATSGMAVNLQSELSKAVMQSTLEALGHADLTQR